jgi:hypothetical protein
MSATLIPVEAAQAAIAAQNSMIINILGYQFNMMSIAIVFAFLGVLFLFYRIQKSDKLDFADMITHDGTSISLSKILQLLGGITATWVIIKLTAAGALTEGLFGIYLGYVAGVEGYSKFVAAKYGYKGGSVKDTKHVVTDDADPSLKPPKE